MSWHLHRFDNRNTLVKALCWQIAQTLEHAVQMRGQASLVVSGGSTPVPLLRALADTDLPWASVVVSLADERWVDEQHADSNAALVRRELLQNYASTARFVSLKYPAADAFEAQTKVSRLLRTSIVPIDMIVLGMGLDGHTASLFPHARGLAQALDVHSELVCHGIAVPGMPYTRMSLGLATILQARRRVLHIEGDDKYQCLQQALQAGAVEAMPVRAILHDCTTETDIYYAP